MEIPREKSFNDVVKALESSKNPSEVLNCVEDCHLETLFETEKILEPFENGGESTIEVYHDSGSLVWENGDYE